MSVLACLGIGSGITSKNKFSDKKKYTLISGGQGRNNESGDKGNM